MDMTRPINLKKLIAAAVLAVAGLMTTGVGISSADTRPADE